MAYIGQKPADKPLGASDITDGIISNSKLGQDIISAETELAEAPADTDEFLISDGGVLKRLDASFIGGGGKVLQVVMAEDTTNRSTTSNSFNDMSASGVNITPSATSSKILVFATTGFYCNGNAYVYSTIFRNGSSVTSDGDGLTKSYSNYDHGDCHSIHYLDSPNTTSQVNYKLAMRNNGNVKNIASHIQVLTVIEIGA